MPTSPSLAARRASSSSCRSFFLISTVPLSAARPLEAGARFAALLLPVWVSRAATVGSFVARDGSAGGPLGDASPALSRGISTSGAEILLARVKTAWNFQGLGEVVPEVVDRLQAHAQAEETGRHPVTFPAGPSLENGAHAAQAGGVRDQPE